MGKVEYLIEVLSQKKQQLEGVCTSIFLLIKNLENINLKVVHGAGFAAAKWRRSHNI